MLLVIGLTQEGLYLRAETRQRAAIAAVFAHRFAAVLAFTCAVGGLAAVHTLACLAPSSAPLAQQTALPFLYGLRGYALPPSAGERGAPNIKGRSSNAKIVTPTPMSKAMVTIVRVRRLATSSAGRPMPVSYFACFVFMRSSVTASFTVKSASPVTLSPQLPPSLPAAFSRRGEVREPGANCDGTHARERRDRIEADAGVDNQSSSIAHTPFVASVRRRK